MIPAYGFCIVVGNSHTISIDNRMDQSVIWEKIARQQENRMRWSQVLFELLQFFPTLSSMWLLISHDLPSSSHYHTYLKVDPTQFQVKLCNLYNLRVRVFTVVRKIIRLKKNDTNMSDSYIWHWIYMYISDVRYIHRPSIFLFMENGWNSRNQLFEMENHYFFIIC